MKNLKLFLVLLSPVVLGMIGCSKGSTGPAGPQGPAGPDSVIHSAWIQLNMTAYLDNYNDTFYYQAISAPAITQGVLDSGIILTYLDVPDPNTGADNLVSAAVYIQEYYALDSIFLYSFAGGGATSGVDYSGLSYRYVVVQGTIKDGTIASGPAKGLTLKQLQNMTYAAVQKLFGLPAKQTSN
ncbi:MAG TPA: hypothetical protein VMI35_00685 [Puia sp.]|nr:hypothetical protein [Puia sp.]